MKLQRSKQTNSYRGQRPPNRRLTERMRSEFPVLYSGMHAGDMLMSDGTITNCSERGLGIDGDASVFPGMELALFVELPGVEEQLCIAQSRVSWVRGRHFGVALKSRTGQDQLRLYAWNSHFRQINNR